MLLSSATDPMAAAMVGEAYTPLDNASGRVGIGDSNTAPNKAQTDLQAPTNKVYLAQDPGYPVRSGSVLTFRVTAGPGVGTYVWREFLLGDGSPGTAWARFVQELNGGVAKGAGETWAVEITATVGRNDDPN